MRLVKVRGLQKDLPLKARELVELFLQGDLKIRTKSGTIRHAERLLKLIQAN